VRDLGPVGMGREDDADEDEAKSDFGPVGIWVVFRGPVGAPGTITLGPEGIGLLSLTAGWVGNALGDGARFRASWNALHHVSRYSVDLQ
jgi:hypothetical protein